jgi:two-component system, NtrC family, nitrogen regulation sensor histidine kinase NtrY
MFGRYPFWGILGVSCCLWILTLLYFTNQQKKLQPAHQAALVTAELNNQENVFGTLLKDTALLRRVFADVLSTEESKRLTELNFKLFGYKNDTLVYWNSNTVTANATDTLNSGTTVIKNEKGVFIHEARLTPGLPAHCHVLALFPIFITYPLENDYLQSHFTASRHIPAGTKIVADSTNKMCFPIKTNNGLTVAYLDFTANPPAKWLPDAPFLSLLCIALLVSIVWIQLTIQRHYKNSSTTRNFFQTCTIIIAIKCVLQFFSLPFNLQELLFFSPQLFYFGGVARSLGDLYINILFLFWFINFIYVNKPFESLLKRSKNIVAKVFVTAVAHSIVFVFATLFVLLVRNFVLFSNISFDVTHIYTIDIYTFFGLLAIVMLAGSVCFIIHLSNIYLQFLGNTYLIKYSVLAFLSIMFCILFSAHVSVAITLCVCIAIAIFLMDLPQFTLVSDLIEPRMIFWAILICGCCTWLLQYFDDIKEKEARKVFVEQRLSPHQDTLLENSFYKTVALVSKDKNIKNFFATPSLAGRKQINQKFETQYLVGQINKYQTKLYLFGKNQEELFNKDTLNYYFLDREKQESSTTNSPYLFYKESILDRHFYIAYIPIFEDSSFRFLGHIFIDLDLKKRVAETVYPELLQPPSSKSNSDENEYAYGIYGNNKLISQTNSYPFQVNLRNESLKVGEYKYVLNNNTNELHYQISDKRTVVVVHNHFLFLEELTLFSYIFGIEVFIALFIVVYRIFVTYYRNKLGKIGFFNLGRRIHFSMMAVLFVSFLIIGSFSILFFKLEYDRSQDLKLQTAMQVTKQSVKDFLSKENAFASDVMFDSVCRTNKTKYLITSIANNQKIDVNIFNADGNLLNTSQDEIYEKGLISRKIRPLAYFQLKNAEKSIVIQDEKVAKLPYRAAYQPLRDEEGVILGYLNVPFFASQKDFNFQVSNIIVALINLYAIIFVASNIFTLFLTRWITGIFSTLTKKFAKLKLADNELLEWSYTDEIGTLVTEYNRMVKKVEENATLLARSERESAWREMAKQVAHEIKNPLTPMKLNIQYLQQAIKNNQPNTKQIVDRVANSIVEQIENLAYIATEFSNFAKLPEAMPELIDLGALLEKASELYQNNEQLKIVCHPAAQQYLIVSDKSQLLRVITNLLENAKQATSEQENAAISISTAISDSPSNTNSSVVFAIQDNGSGIDADAAKKIFQPYFTTKSSGTGLGLAMCKKIIEYWKGEIWFESEIGKGTTFYVRFPLAENN